MEGILISAKSFTDSSEPYLLLDNKEGKLVKFSLKLDQKITITPTSIEQKFCCGWYDISSHTNYPCSNSSLVEKKYDSCFNCRSKTNFNPAFYNTTDTSEEQQNYNQTPHTVYISYFGDGITKAGIMSDSRGLTRIYEQGALLYVLIDSFPDADLARKVEKKLILKGLKESVRKNQKAATLSSTLKIGGEINKFQQIIDSLNIEKELEIKSNLDEYYYNRYSDKPIKPLPENKPISGTIQGVVGNYLILENNEKLYGKWLSELYGYNIKLNEDIKLIPPEPEQISLF
jgi:hypothetical protein